MSGKSAPCYHGQHVECRLEGCDCECHGNKNEQPLPTPSDSPFMQNLVQADVEKRKEIGIKRYGTLLQAHNGRDFLWDAYEEALDLVMYLRGCLYERDGK